MCTNFAPLSSIIASLKAESDCFPRAGTTQREAKRRSVVICQPKLAIKQCGRKTGSDISIAGNDIDQRKLWSASCCLMPFRAAKVRRGGPRGSFQINSLTFSEMRIDCHLTWSQIRIDIMFICAHPVQSCLTWLREEAEKKQPSSSY